MKILSLIALGAIVYSCSSLNKEECQSANWYDMGVKDSLAGKREMKSSEYAQDCKEHNVTVDFKTYKTGFDKGLNTYCTENKGYSLGLKGVSRHPMCDALNKKFANGYDAGYIVYEREQKRLAEEARLKKIEEERQARIAENQVLFDKYNQCNNNFDCEKRSLCQMGRCEASGNSCRYNSDCESVGSCRTQRKTVGSKTFDIGVCRY